MDKDLSYYRRRTADEKAAAEAASDSRAKAVHIELARRYDQRCAALGAQLEVTAFEAPVAEQEDLERSGLCLAQPRIANPSRTG